MRFMEELKRVVAVVLRWLSLSVSSLSVSSLSLVITRWLPLALTIKGKTHLKLHVQAEFCQMSFQLSWLWENKTTVIVVIANIFFGILLVTITLNPDLCSESPLSSSSSSLTSSSPTRSSSRCIIIIVLLFPNVITITMCIVHHHQRDHPQHGHHHTVVGRYLPNSACSLLRYIATSLQLKKCSPKKIPPCYIATSLQPSKNWNLNLPKNALQKKLPPRYIATSLQLTEKCPPKKITPSLHRYFATTFGKWPPKKKYPLATSLLRYNLTEKCRGYFFRRAFFGKL